MRRIGFGVLLAAMLVNGPTFGRLFYSGNALWEMCRSDEGTLMWATCMGYVVGVAEFTDREAGAPLGTEACIPKGVTQFQLRDVVVQYLEENPDKRHLPAQLLVYAAVSLAFPCE